MLHLDDVQAEDAVLQPIRDLCFDAEGTSMHRCQVSGQLGQARVLGGKMNIATLYDRHEEMEADEERER